MGESSMERYDNRVALYNWTQRTGAGVSDQDAWMRC
jgi:hypothetical protein